MTIDNKNNSRNANKANLRDFIAATGLVILLKLDSNHRLFAARVTLKFDGWPRKTIGHLLEATSSFVHYLKAIRFKLESQSGIAQFRSKFAFSNHATLKFDGWLWKTIGYLVCATSHFVYDFITMSQLKLELQSGNAEFGSKSVIFCPVWPWNFTYDLENNEAPLLCYFQICASFHSHLWIQTGVMVLKHPIRVKIVDVLSCVTLKYLTDDIEKQKGISLMPHQAWCIISLPYVNSDWSYGPETA